MSTAEDDATAVANFQAYLRIKTVQPNPDYAGAVVWLKEQAAQLELKFHVVEPAEGKPVVVMTWVGSQPQLPSIMLNSHIDVVPVFPEHWKYDPFSATMEENGDIYARGSQDMKCVGIQYLEAIRRLRKASYQPQRTIHVTFVPEEELGGALGMELFVNHKDFVALNVGFCMDEGLASPGEEFPVFYGERAPWWLKITCQGQPGHGSQFLENTAGEKIRKVINKFLELRDSEERKLKESNGSLTLGDVITLNLTKLEGGVQFNVVPAELVVGFDMRIPPTCNLVELEARIRGWLKEAGEGVELTFILKSTHQGVTHIDSPSISEHSDASNPWWTAFAQVAKGLGWKLKPQIMSGTTDARFLRTLGIPALNFSPMNNTPLLLHDHNEFLNRDVFVRGIGFYQALILALSSLQ